MLGENDTPTDSTTGSEASVDAPVDAPSAADETPTAEAVPETTAKKAATKRAPAKRATAKKATTRKTTTKKAAAEPVPTEAFSAESAQAESVQAESVPAESAPTRDDSADAPAKKVTAKRSTRRTTKKAAAAPSTDPGALIPSTDATTEPLADNSSSTGSSTGSDAVEPDVRSVAAEPAADALSTAAPVTPPPATALMFQPPDPAKATVVRRTRGSGSSRAASSRAAKPATVEPTDTPEGIPAVAGQSGSGPQDRVGADEVVEETALNAAAPTDPTDPASQDTDDTDTDTDSDTDSDTDTGSNRRRRRRGGRRRRKSGSGDDSSDADTDSGAEQDDDASRQSGQAGQAAKGEDTSRKSDTSGNGDDDSSSDADTGGESAGTRRRRRRRRAGEEGDGGPDDPENTVVRVRKQRSPEDEITAVSGSTRLEAKKQRRREGREAGRRRAPIVSEAEFLARREAVERVMVIRQRADLTQIAVLEDKVLVEHYVARESQTSIIGNVYLGRVQNVLPSMEAAFIDIGKGRNAVLYAGEVNWDSLGAGNGPRKIEQVLKSGQPVLVQVTKDPIGHKGARLTSQVSLPGRFLVYVPDGTTSGISRKLPDTERNRLKTLLKEIVPGSASVIVRTAAEGASEDELTLDVERLKARWEEISDKVAKGNAPQLLYGEPDLTLKVVRDLFTEDFVRLVVSGDDAWDLVEGYVENVAPDLSERLERYQGDKDVFAAHRIDEQIDKALDRKVWLPSGGSLVIDRTEAMTVVDVNTGKFTGSGGNLEETVTKNNLEAAEEVIRQLRLRDIGGIIVVDFIDMVLESNRDLVLRRMVECLGRDRTRHQVAEVTSLGLVQMTRKRIGTGLLEAFTEPCEHCQGRGLTLHHEPVEKRETVEEDPRRGRRSRGRSEEDNPSRSAPVTPQPLVAPSPRDVAAMAKPPVETTAPVRTPEDPVTDEPAVEPSGGEPVPAAGVDERPEVPAVSEPVVDPTDAETGAPQQPENITAAESDAGPEPEPERTPEPEPESAPAAPQVTTSSRRRMARRPAGPPVSRTASPEGSDLPETPATQESPEPAGTAPGAVETTPTSGGAEVGNRVAIHVPVKQKGARKR